MLVSLLKMTFLFGSATINVKFRMLFHETVRKIVRRRGKMEYKDNGKKPYMVNIQDATAQNDNFRIAIWTGEKLQLTVMSIEPNDEAGLEVHEGIDQFIRIEEGQGICKMGSTKDNLDFERAVTKGDAVLVPMNMWHNIINTGGQALKLYTIYSGQEHEEGTIHLSREDAPKK